jgi:hypothetical protein
MNIMPCLNVLLSTYWRYSISRSSSADTTSLISRVARRYPSAKKGSFHRSLATIFISNPGGNSSIRPTITSQDGRLLPPAEELSRFMKILEHYFSVGDILCRYDIANFQSRKTVSFS